MPYIKEETRKELDDLINQLRAKIVEITPENKSTLAGNLNYCITRILDTAYRPDLTYDNLNKVIGVLECAKLEFYRRVAAPYEETKLNANGDVYPRGYGN